MGRTPLGSALWRAWDKQQVENQQRDPNVDRRVGNIKDEKVTAKRVQIEIVEDRSMRKTIDRIAECAANDQSKACGGQCGSGSKEPPREQTGRSQSQRKQNGLPRRRIAGEQAERNAPVPL
jgi:hypothetical protein